MVLFRWALLTVTAVVFSLTQPLLAQTPSQGNVKIISNPNETVVTLKGEYTLRGQTPYVVVHSLKGFYELEAKKRGYENFTSSYVFNPSVRKKLAIRLTPKSRLRSFSRSMVLPGWGQVYTDQKWKGVLLAGLQLGAAGYFVYTHVDYQDAKDDYDKALDIFASSGSSQDATIYLDVQEKYDILSTKYDNRNTALILNLSVYLYNLIDTLFFYPKYHYPNIRATASVMDDGKKPTLAFGLRANF
ncbi:MAG: PEGA domain-containing protein [Calditrichaeota bacterium]|nr:MAG: PEGA domain-containing protein [Calditrichota bacterium]